MAKLPICSLVSSHFKIRASFGLWNSTIEIFIMSAVNETLIRDVVAEVLGRLNGAPASPARTAAPAASKQDCGCNGKGHSSSSPARRGNLGVFEDANEACVAAQEAFLQLQQKGVAARVKIVEIVKSMA